MLALRAAIVRSGSPDVDSRWRRRAAQFVQTGDAVVRLFCSAGQNVDKGRYSVSADEFAGANDNRHQSDEKEKGDPGSADRRPKPQPADEQQGDRIGTDGQ